MNKKGFTLAEIIIVLTILGIIAMITVPSLVRHQNEVAERTKLKKIWKMYDQVIQNMAVENDLVGEEALKDFAEADNCGNCRKYFRTSKYAEDGNYCVFKTHDGVWMNISDILHPTVTLDKNNEQTDDNTFTMVTRYDSSIRAFRTNDANYSGLTNDEKTALKNFFSKLGIIIDSEEQIVTKINEWGMTFQKECSKDPGNIYSKLECYYKKKEYDSDGNVILEYIGCNSSGNNCEWSLKYEYDSNGKLIYDTYCDGNGENCSPNVCKYKLNSDGYTWYYYNCDENGLNCSYINKYKYDSNGLLLAEYYNCNNYGLDCSGISRAYEYDENGNMIKDYYSVVDNPDWFQKYDYDEKGNQTNRYDCYGINECYLDQRYENEYDDNGRLMIRKDCSASGDYCWSSIKYEYDNAGNIKKLLYYCDGEGNNCQGSDTYLYDDNGNKIAHNASCDVKGNKCASINEYTYTKVK